MRQQITSEAIAKMKYENYNCAQAIVYAMLKIEGCLDINSDLIKQARIFGGGVAGLKQTCGYINGVALVYNNLIDDLDEAKLKVHAFSDKLVEVSNSMQCKEIISEYEDKTLKGRKEKCSTMLIELIKYLDENKLNN